MKNMREVYPNLEISVSIFEKRVYISKHQPTALSERDKLDSVTVR